MRLLIWLLIVGQTLCLNFVFYITIVGKSHLNYINTMVSTLVDAGHTVDVIISRLNSDVDTKGVSKVRNMTVVEFDGESPWMKVPHLNDPFDDSQLIKMDVFYDVTVQLCEIAIRQGKVLEFLKNGNYDAMIISDYDWCPAIFAHQAGIKTTIGFVATNMLTDQTLHLGLPNPASAVVGNFEIDASFSIWEKLKRMYNLWHNSKFALPPKAAVETALARKYFSPDFPDAQDLSKQYDLVFVNSNEIIEIPRTISSKVHYIGGINLPKPKKLSQEFDNRLSAAKRGTVLVSFGTQIPSDKFNQRAKTALINAFKKFSDFTFIWKYTQQPGDFELFANSTNIQLVSWMPQTDALYDSRVVAFITHSGLNSFLETSYAGVPIISIPLFADQFHNARAAERIGTGIYLDKLTMDETDVYNALRKVLYEESYKINARKIAQMLANKPNKPKEIFVKWVEYAATHKGLHKHLSLPEAHLSVYEYYCMDLAAILLCAALALLIAFRFLILYTLSFVKTNLISYMKLKAE